MTVPSPRGYDCDPCHCFNGCQDADEEGADCGGARCLSCDYHCSNGYLDSDEEAIDCGGYDCSPC